ncbi:MAG: HAD hydrolase-like protein [Verrucomicrobiales bacterium]|nr:HAD hydrolase-like protein [Verrucomicrobiales bacterium]
MIKPALLFDLDGTVTNPAPGFLASIRYAMEKLGVPYWPDEKLLPFIGPPLRQSMGTILETDDPELIEEGVELYRYRLDNGGKFEAEIHDGIPEILEHFSALEYPLFICTGKPECVAGEIVTHFGLRHFFREVYGAKLDGTHGDKADLIRHIRQEQDLTKTPPIMIGDTAFDIRAAKANDLSSIGVSWGFGSKDILLSEGADVLVSTPSGLKSAIENLAPNHFSRTQ